MKYAIFCIRTNRAGCTGLGSGAEQIAIVRKLENAVGGIIKSTPASWNWGQNNSITFLSTIAEIESCSSFARNHRLTGKKGSLL
jgi:hypothetical protein